MEKTLLHVGGAKGVGKTRLLSEFRGQQIKGRETYITHVSELLRSIAKEKFERWTELTAMEKREIRFEAINSIKKMRYDIVILDSHYVEFDKGQFRAIIPEEFKREITAHVVVEADCNTIFSRRLSDKTTKRELNLESIKAEILAERDTAKIIADGTNTSIYIVNNDSLELAVREFKKVLESLV